MQSGIQNYRTAHAIYIIIDITKEISKVVLYLSNYGFETSQQNNNCIIDGIRPIPYVNRMNSAAPSLKKEGWSSSCCNTSHTSKRLIHCQISFTMSISVSFLLPLTVKARPGVCSFLSLSIMLQSLFLYNALN